jgi:membrane-bound serine protease (ClpP class)
LFYQKQGLKMKIFRYALLLLLTLPAFLLSAWSTMDLKAVQEEPAPVVMVLQSEGPITPVLIEYLDRGLQRAVERNAEVVILELDTPGGSIDIMNRIVQMIRASTIPVVVYVYPNNAMAGSAGTVITLAGHLAAMAPETTIGAASPVGSGGEDIGDTMESKVKEILKASVRGLTKNRSAEATRLAEETIENARAVTVEEALDAGLIDFMAVDVADLLRQLDGREVILNDRTIVLHTQGAEVVNLGNTLVEELLLTLVNPNLVFLLMAVGIQGILIEIASPGGWVAGFIGVTCLLLAGYGIGVLPVNWFGILFVLAAFVLFLLDIKAPTHGALTITGAASFIMGALILFNSTPLPGFPTVSIPLVIGTGLVIAGIFFTIMTIALRAQSRPVQFGRETFPGKLGRVEVELNPRGTVRVNGELWSAELIDGAGSLPKGAPVEVISIKGLVLQVRRTE